VSTDSNIASKHRDFNRRRSVLTLMNHFLFRRGVHVESEEGQARFRLHASLTALLVYAFAASTLASVSTADVLCVVVYASYAGVWVLVVSENLGQPQTRQWIALTLDVVVFSACLAAAGRSGAALTWVPVTTSVGHGLRFGQRRGTVAACLSAVGLFLAVRFGPGWQLPMSIALGASVTALVAPVYVVRLVRVMEQQRHEAEVRTKQLEHAVRSDGLTGVLNRTGFEAAWAALSDDVGRTKAPVGLIYLDLDGFKAVNDTQGHEAGNAHLQAVARLLVQSVRHSDAVARLGGDEFAILVHAPANIDDVSMVAEKAVGAIRAHGAGMSGEVKLGASAGVAYALPGSSLPETLRLADERMFAAKRSAPGRKERSISSHPAGMALQAEPPGQDEPTPGAR
jgi:diguanylate cyclase (GGDEF)-like protein